MKDFAQVKSILNEQNVSSDDQGIVEYFLSQFSFPKRQQLMGVLTGFPEKISVFIDLIKMKKSLAENYDSSLAEKILNLENNIVNDLVSEINSD